MNSVHGECSPSYYSRHVGQMTLQVLLRPRPGQRHGDVSPPPGRHAGNLGAQAFAELCLFPSPGPLGPLLLSCSDPRGRPGLGREEAADSGGIGPGLGAYGLLEGGGGSGHGGWGTTWSELRPSPGSGIR